MEKIKTIDALLAPTIITDKKKENTLLQPIDIARSKMNNLNEKFTNVQAISQVLKLNSVLHD